MIYAQIANVDLERAFDGCFQWALRSLHYDDNLDLVAEKEELLLKS